MKRSGSAAMVRRHASLHEPTTETTASAPAETGWPSTGQVALTGFRSLAARRSAATPGPTAARAATRGTRCRIMSVLLDRLMGNAAATDAANAFAGCITPDTISGARTNDASRTL